VERDKGALGGEILHSFILMGLMAAVLGVYLGAAMLAVRALG
jgi:hypothetical protein